MPTRSGVLSEREGLVWLLRSRGVPERLIAGQIEKMLARPDPKKKKPRA